MAGKSKKIPENVTLQTAPACDETKKSMRAARVQQEALPVVEVDEDSVRKGITRYQQKQWHVVVSKWAWEICLRVAQGQPLKQICKLEHLPNINVVLSWIHPDPEVVNDDIRAFQAAYKRAINQQNELLMDELVHVARTARNKDDAAAAKVVLDAMKFRLERTQADKYGPTSRVVQTDEKGLGSLDAEGTANQLEAAMLLIAERRRALGRAPVIDNSSITQPSPAPVSLGERTSVEGAKQQ